MAKRVLAIGLFAALIGFSVPKPAAAHVNFSFLLGLPPFGFVASGPAYYPAPEPYYYPGPSYYPSYYSSYYPAPYLAVPAFYGHGGYYGYRGYYGHGGYSRGFHQSRFRQQQFGHRRWR